MARRRKKKGPKVTAEIHEITPTAQRFQHDDIERAAQSRGSSTADRPPLRVMTENVLDRYLRTKMRDSRTVIDQKQHDAGMRLYAEWRVSGFQARIIGSYGVRFDGPSDISQHQANVYTSVQRALKDVGGLCQHVLVHVCLHNGTARDWARNRGMPEHVARTYGIWLLRDALNMLVHHYETGRRGGGRMR
jgi:hypothetical protein